MSDRLTPVAQSIDDGTVAEPFEAIRRAGEEVVSVIADRIGVAQEAVKAAHPGRAVIALTNKARGSRTWYALLAAAPAPRSLTPETVEGLRLSKEKDLMAARLLDRAAGYVDEGWTQCCDAVDANGSGVLPFSKRAECWCALGAIRAAKVRIGLVTLYQDAAGDLQYPKAMPPFAASVYSRALCAAAQAMIGRTPKHPAMYASVVTNWNDTEAMSGETVARKLREAAALIWRRIEDTQRAIRGGAS